MNTRTQRLTGTMLLPLFAAAGILLMILARYLGGATPLTALVGGTGLTLYLAAIAVGAFLFGTEVEQRPAEA